MRLPALLTALLLALGACGTHDASPSPSGTPDGGGAGGDGGNPGPVSPAVQARALDLLRASPYSRLELEVDSVPGKAPRAASISFIESALAKVVDKPAGVKVVLDQQDVASRGADHVWTDAELFPLAQQTFGNNGAAGTIRMHVLFVDGSYQNPDVLGIAWASTHLVLFKDVIEHYCRQDPSSLVSDAVCAASEQGVWLHETGHLLGLVNNGLSMVQPHEDATHAKHDASDQCIMYWAFEAPSSIQLLAKRLGAGSPQLEFDAACQADLAKGRAGP
ncbi:hypothetical protein FGE12_03045 [Aggregicoccus sp. 17bor-14]|uniref:hypothetical protein n=1 Tax=Myxococcaceae TaxID=31 RepID=UPI00129CF636|nr:MULTISPECIES: hypothetical protein [Myxococcaceae]MBF5041348.1 hypothetical protein [Simulacricoccus sp. 17bor-14]MRI87134.1 hypothetical protein [Aggregicoccus sp. 17bor-14]